MAMPYHPVFMRILLASARFCRRFRTWNFSWAIREWTLGCSIRSIPAWDSNRRCHGTTEVRSTGISARKLVCIDRACGAPLSKIERAPFNESYKRGCQEKFFPLPLRREMAVVACIQPNLSSGEAVGSLRIPDRPSQLAFSTRRFHDAMVVRRLRLWKLRKQERWPKWANHGPI